MSKLIAGATILLGALVLAPAAQALTYEVDRGDDPAVTGCVAATPNDCSLRGAIQNSNASAGVADQITFAGGVTGEITLASELLVTDPVTITGPGAASLAISGNDNTRILRTNLATAGGNVFVSGLTLTDGDSLAQDGGAILNDDAALTVTDTVIRDSRAVRGGGIHHAGGDAALGANNNLIRSTVTGNFASQGGGGLNAVTSFGTIQSSTIADNDAALPDVGGAPQGGGVSGRGSILNATIAGNFGEGGAGGVFAPGGGPITMANSIIGDNTKGPVGAIGPDIFGNFSASFSLIEDPTGAGANVTETVAGSMITGVDPRLAALASNGGPTPTKLLLPVSPAIDRGSVTGIDQRSFARPVDLADRANSTANFANGADMGAVELTVSEAFNPPTGQRPSVELPVNPVPGQQPPTAKCKAKKKKKKKRSATVSAKCKKKKKKKKK